MSLVKITTIRDDWANRNGLKRTTAFSPCLHWLAIGQCNKWVCDTPALKWHGGWYDHGSAWVGPRFGPGRRDYARLLLGQPYVVSLREIQELTNHPVLAEGIESGAISVHYGDAPWYMHGASPDGTYTGHRFDGAGPFGESDYVIDCGVFVAYRLPDVGSSR